MSVGEFKISAGLATIPMGGTLNCLLSLGVGGAQGGWKRNSSLQKVGGFMHAGTVVCSSTLKMKSGSMLARTQSIC